MTMVVVMVVVVVVMVVMVAVMVVVVMVEVIVTGKCALIRMVASITTTMSPALAAGSLLACVQLLQVLDTSTLLIVIVALVLVLVVDSKMVM